MEKSIKNTRKKLSRRKKIIIVTAAMLSVAVIVSAIVGIIHYRNNKAYRPFDYENEDLSRYIYISAENYHGYKGYEVEVAMDEITDDSVKTAIIQLLAGERADPSAGGAGEQNATVAVGDDIMLYFQAYKINEDGSKGEPLEGFGNFTDKEDSSRIYTIGGGFIDSLGLNLELKLVGADLSKYTACEIQTEGQIQSDDIIFLTYTSFASKNGVDGWEERSATERRLNLKDGIDSEFGEGFTEMLLSGSVGEANKNPSANDYSTDEYKKIIYNNIKVEYVMRLTNSSQEPLRIKTVVPAEYSDTSIQGEPVLFELYIDYAIKYNTPELTEDFIKKTLEISDETLSEYEGDDTIARFYSYTRDLLEKNEQAEIDALRIEAMWLHYYNIAEFKELPEDEIKRLINVAKKKLEDGYNANNNGYSTFDEYANAYVAYLGYELVWTDYLRLAAEAEIKEKLIFYYVARAEGLLPTEAEFLSLLAKMKEEDLEYLLSADGISRDDYDSDAEYNSAVEPYRKQIEAIYADEEYMRYQVHLKYAEPKMSQLGIIKYRRRTETAALD